jgi:ribosome-associated protein
VTFSSNHQSIFTDENKENKESQAPGNRVSITKSGTVKCKNLWRFVVFVLFCNRIEIQTLCSMNKPSAKPTASANFRDVLVREVPIELCQFIKFGGLSGSGGEAKQLIAEGSVRLNGTIEKQKRKKLVAGDQVTVAGQTIVVKVG